MITTIINICHHTQLQFCFLWRELLKFILLATFKFTLFNNYSHHDEHCFLRAYWSYNCMFVLSLPLWAEHVHSFAFPPKMWFQDPPSPWYPSLATSPWAHGFLLAGFPELPCTPGCHNDMTGIPLLFKEKENVMHRKCSIRPATPEYLGHVQGGIKEQFYIALCAHLCLKIFSPSTIWGIKKVKKPGLGMNSL